MKVCGHASRDSAAIAAKPGRRIARRGIGSSQVWAGTGEHSIFRQALDEASLAWFARSRRHAIAMGDGPISTTPARHSLELLSSGASSNGGCVGG